MLSRVDTLAVVIVLATAIGAMAGGAACPPSVLTDAPPADGGWQPRLTTDGPRNITIIESRSINPGHSMDLEWQALATGMGHTATIVEQDALDDIASLASADVLIVASGVIDLGPVRVQTIRQFVESRGPAYLQGEYLPAHSGNQAFAEIVDALGGSFTISGTVSGDLVPMNVLGSLAAQPNSVPTLPYFWYGCAGTGDVTVESFLEYGGDYFGWIFTEPRGDGRLVHTTDQDWVNSAGTYPASAALMENILAYLAEHADTAADESTWGAIKAMYR